MFEQYVICIFSISVNCKISHNCKDGPDRQKKKKENFKESEGKEHDSSQNWAL